MYGRLMIDPVAGMASDPPASNGGIDAGQAPKASRARLVVALTLLAFIIGLGAMAWMMTHWRGGLRFGPPADPATLTSSSNDAGNAMELADPTQGMPDSSGSARGSSIVLGAGQQDARVIELEQRLTRIAVAAEVASAFANRAEAMMVAFAARRSLDAGVPLGYVEGQLRVLFGDAQPKAVATIVNAASEPVTLSTLRAGLETASIAVERGSPDESWWSGAMREVRGLAVIRPAGAPSPEPRQRIARARLNVESGQIEAAINEIAGLPRQPETIRWLEQARRYNEARRALDVIEAAAILEPRVAPMIGVAPRQGAAPAASRQPG
jgi:hypothetical protein